jgi:hypothetical protein
MNRTIWFAVLFFILVVGIMNILSGGESYESSKKANALEYSQSEENIKNLASTYNGHEDALEARVIWQE